MKWSIKEEEIVCKFYLEHQNDWKQHIDIVMKELSNNGFKSRTEISVKMRISNISNLHTGIGLSHVSKQTRETYNRLK
jgi:hypothetical protein